MKRGRPRGEPKSQYSFYITEENEAKLRLLTLNPMTKMSYKDERSASALINRLLREYFESLVKTQ